jgi:hypothetical protein
MEELFKQSFNYARIRLFKNYSDRFINPELVNSLNNEEKIDSLQEPVRKFTVSAVKHPPTCTLRLYLKGKKKSNFFHTMTPNESFENHALLNHPIVQYERINLVSVNRPHKNDYFETTKDKHIKAHYNNPFASIETYRIERWIRRNGNKITIKLYYLGRSRDLNSIYFTKATDTTTLTFDLNNGNFLVTSFDKSRKAQKKHFYANSFTSLKQALGTIYRPKEKMSSSSSLFNEFMTKFDNEKFTFALMKCFNLDIDFSSTEEFYITNFMAQWISKFAQLKKIKLPNDGKKLLTQFYPTERYLKKNDRKLVAAVLDRFGVKSNITIKILHKNPYMNMLTLVQSCRLLGTNYPKYIGNIPIKFFTRSENNKNDAEYTKNVILDKNTCPFFDISKSEKDNVVKIITDYTINLTQYAIGDSHDLISMFCDHFRMLKRVNEYYPEMKLNARTYDTFHLEHTELSGIVRGIKSGWSIKYVFDGIMIREIEKVIEIHRLEEMTEPDKPYGDFANITKDVFIPKVLTSSEEYVEEGLYMHHCVAGYVNTEHSIIISLRKGRERVTNEFDVKTRHCIQSKYFHNQEPPDYYRKALIHLSDRIRSFPYSLKPIEKIKERLKINGKVVIPDVETIEVPYVYPLADNNIFNI